MQRSWGSKLPQFGTKDTLEVKRGPSQQAVSTEGVTTAQLGILTGLGCPAELLKSFKTCAEARIAIAVRITVLLDFLVLNTGYVSNPAMEKSANYVIRACIKNRLSVERVPWTSGH